MCISFLNDLTKIDNVEEQDRIKIFDKDFINLERLWSEINCSNIFLLYRIKILFAFLNVVCMSNDWGEH